MDVLGLDFIDRRILAILQEDGRASHSSIAEAVGLSQPSVHERVKKLEQRGVIKGYTAIVDPEALRLGVLAFISVRFKEHRTADVSAAISDDPHVLESHHIAGEDCMLVKVRCHSPRDLEAVLDRIWKSGPIGGTSTTIAFSSYKETTALPVDDVHTHEDERRSA
jgi:Lrp/AsnC family leucine-responsive transcriptional regulator